MQFDIRNFGAVGDGSTVNTSAIQKAIEACATAGGGEVVVPAGRFVTGTIRLKTGVMLNLSAGAVLLGSSRIADYAADVHRNMYANEAHLDRCLIFAREAKRIGIIGQGAIDGQGTTFPAIGDVAKNRPMLIRFVECEDVLLRDVALLNPASWTAAILYCNHVCADNVRIHSRANENGDGLDFDGCRDVRVSNCSLDTSDDAICLQTSRTDRPCENVAITNCTMSGRWVGIRVGFLSIGMIRDIVVSNCVFRDIEDAALMIQMNEGGVIENVRFSNLMMREVARVAFITLNRHRVGAEMPPGVPPMGALHNVHITGVRMQTTRAQDRKPAFIIVGAPDAKIENVSIADADLTIPGGGEPFEGRLSDIRELGASRPEHRALGGTLPAYGIYARHVSGLSLSGIRFRLDMPDPRPAKVLDDVTLED